MTIFNHYFKRFLIATILIIGTNKATMSSSQFTPTKRITVKILLINLPEFIYK